MLQFKSLLLGSILMFGATACGDVAKTSFTAPNTVETNGKSPTLDTVLSIRSDATSAVRRAQANSDIRAREQRYNLFGEGDRADRDLESEVRSKLEVNLPLSQLAIDAEEGNITVAGVVQIEKNLQRIEPLAKEIRGVESVEVKAVLGMDLPSYKQETLEK